MDAVATLQPLVHALASARALRLVARPGWVTMDGPRGTSPVEVPWTEEQHRLALAAAPGTLGGGFTLIALGDHLVLRRPPDPQRRIEQLSEEGWLSQLAGRTLAAALGLGRNVLFVGPEVAGVELVAALLAGGT